MSNSKISSGEFSAILFISQISFIGAVSADILGNNYSDSVLAAILSSIVSCVLFLPLFILKDRNVTSDGDNRFQAFLFLIFSAYTAAWDVSSVAYMMRNTVFGQLNSWVFCAVFVAAAIYCAGLGLETIARSSQIVVIVFLISAVMLSAAAVKHVETANIRVPFFSGGNDFALSFGGVFSKFMILPQCYFVIGHLKKDKKKSTFGLKTSVTVLSGGIVTAATVALVMLCLGGYALTQEFPVFTLASFLDLAPLQRLDIFLGIALLTSGLIKTALNVFVIRSCSKLLSEKNEKTCFYISVVILSALSAFTAGQPGLQKKFYSPWIVIISGIVLGALIPQINMSVSKKPERRKK